jgi:glycosyltransferase involved in cell wall biosynthesis
MSFIFTTRFRSFLHLPIMPAKKREFQLFNHWITRASSARPPIFFETGACAWTVSEKRRPGPVSFTVVASMLSFHRWIKTWNSKAGFYLVATKFYQRKFIEGGLPAEKVLLKPHFISPDPEPRPEDQHGEYALFIGRLDPEKGVRTLLEAWKTLKAIPLIIRGGGQMECEVSQFIKDNDLSKIIDVIGRLSKEELTEKIKKARFLVWPSEGFYETFGYVAVESFSCGVPVIASRIGVLREIVADGVTGLHFTPGDSQDLAAKVRWAWEHPAEMAEMGRNARREYEAKYTAEKNYGLLMEIYQRAIAENSAVK